MARDGITLCGALTVVTSGRDVTAELPGRQGRTVLAYLAARHPEPVPREELVRILWPGEADAPRSARDALNVVVSKLKRALGAGLLTGRDPLALTLPPGMEIDLRIATARVIAAEAALAASDNIRALESAQSALPIVDGGALPGLEGDWIEVVRRDVEELRLRALDAAAQATVGLGGSALSEAERYARALIAAAPFRESGHRMLMEVLAARGDVAEALRVYDDLRVRLREDLGAVPAPALTELHSRLLNNPPAPVTPPTAVGPARATIAVTPPPAVPVTPRVLKGVSLPLPSALVRAAAEAFVGRHQMIRALSAAYAQAGGPGALRGPRLIAIAGEPGVGKTTLAAQFAALRHAEGALVLHGRCDEEALAPYQPFAEALDPLASAIGSAEGASAEGSLRAELSRILPGEPARLGDEAPAAPEIERFRLFTAVEELLAPTARAGEVLLVLDDLHWADRPTLALLRHLVRAELRAPLLVLATFRDVEVAAGHPLRQLLVDLRREGLSERLDLGGLNEDEVRALVQALAATDPTDAVVQRLRSGTDGNPLFIRELLRAAGGDLDALFAAVPEGVRELLERRLARMPAPVTRALSVAAVAGREFDLRVIERVEDLSGIDVLDALEAAAEARLVGEVPGRPGVFAFTHALVRDALYQGLSGARRARLHLQVADALQLGASGRQATEVAHHLVQAGGHVGANRVVDALRAAGVHARTIFAYEEAAAHFEAALAVGANLSPEEQCDLLLAAGEARMRGGELAEARELCSRAAALSRDHDAARFARAALGVRGPYSDTGVVDLEAVALLEQAIAGLSAEDTALRTLCQARLAQALYWSPSDHERMHRLSAEAVMAAELLDDPHVLAAALEARHEVLRVPWALDERRRLVARVLDRAEALGDRELAAQAHQLRAVDALEAGDLEEHERSTAAVERAAAALRQPLLERYVTMWHHVRAQLDGRLADAERLAHEALGAALRAGAQDGAQAFGAQLFGVLRYRGGIELLLPMVNAIVVEYPSLAVWRAGLALINAELGNPEAARAELETLKQTRVAEDYFWHFALSLAGDAVVSLGLVEHAAELHPRLTPYAAHNVCARGAACYGPMARTVGGLAAVLGEHDEARRRFEQAVVLSRRLRSPVLEVHARVDQAQAELRAGENADQLLRGAATAARRLGAQRLVQRAEALLEGEQLSADVTP